MKFIFSLKIILIFFKNSIETHIFKFMMLLSLILYYSQIIIIKLEISDIGLNLFNLEDLLLFK